MALEVERLLAQIGQEHNGSRRAAVAVHPAATARSTIPRDTSHRDGVLLWIRLALAAGLGVMMTQWPYQYDCDWPLAGYLGAVTAIMVAGGWLMMDAWRMRRPVAHVAALVVAFWGVVLAAEQLLPRIGYAAESAVWRCVGS
jgi:hypothetical protein